jgi:hypothetical protein
VLGSPRVAAKPIGGRIEYEDEYEDEDEDEWIRNQDEASPNVSGQLLRTAAAEIRFAPRGV